MLDNSLLDLDSYDFTLPEDKIARFAREESSRLLFVQSGIKLDDLSFESIVQFLQPNDLLVVNETIVEKRRVYLKKENRENSKKRFEALFLEQSQSDAKLWRVLLKGSKKLKTNDSLFSEIDNRFRFQVVKVNNEVFLQSDISIGAEEFEKIGQMPIPPYFKREAVTSDTEGYQNPWGKITGSIAAPTASLHFKKYIREQLINEGVQIQSLCLHIGYGTFAKVTDENLTTAKLHRESYQIPESLAVRLREKKYNRLIVLGTTALRALEHVHRKSSGRFDSHLQGQTDIFLYLPDTILTADYLITNFHLPKSSLLLLVACLVGQKEILRAYHHAIKEGYLFYSYGDAMIVENIRKSTTSE